MTELSIRPDEIRDAIARNVESFTAGTSREEVGQVTQTGDGIARVEGLHSAMTNELLEFEGGLKGLALNLDVREIGAVLLGDGSKVAEGQSHFSLALFRSIGRASCRERVYDAGHDR